MDIVKIAAAKFKGLKKNKTKQVPDMKPKMPQVKGSLKGC